MVLQNVGLVAVIEPGHHHVAALDQLHALLAVDVQRFGQQLFHPRAGRVDQAPRLYVTFPARDGVAQAGLPGAVPAFGPDQRRAGEDLGALFGCRQGVKHHQAGVVDPAVGITESLADFRL